MKNQKNSNLFNIIVIVAALGYFVDIYDLILFGIVKNPSLHDLGIINSIDQFSQGNFLLSMQMAGMLLGGIFFGVLGDKKGRLSTLFITIALYSLANIANGFIQNIHQYSILRFIAGFGLSGELGVGVTLVSEVMSKEKRGLGASIVSGIGIVGAVFGFLVAELFSWRVAYWTGGGLGLLLLLMRVSVYESGMFEKTKSSSISRGNFFSIFTNGIRFKKFMLSILVGIPTWYSVSVLAINAPSMAETLGIEGIKGSSSVMWHYIGAAIGSISFGYLSNYLKSRRKALFIAIISMALLTVIYFLLFRVEPSVFYLTLCLLGIPMGGLWAVFITTVSEQFGTNIRATVTTSAPNFVRGTTIIITWLLGFFASSYGLWNSGVMTGVIVMLVALIGVIFIPDTFGKDLDYVEK